VFLVLSLVHAVVGGGGARGKGVIVIFVIIVKLPLLRYYLGEPQVTPYLTHYSEICFAFTITYIYSTYLKNKTILRQWFIHKVSVYAVYNEHGFKKL
jgi:hypothetical protein